MKQVSIAQVIGWGRRPGQVVRCLLAPGPGVLAALSVVTLTVGGIAAGAAVSGVGSGHHPSASPAAQVLALPQLAGAGTDRLAGTAALDVAGGVNDGWSSGAPGTHGTPGARPVAHLALPRASRTPQPTLLGSTSQTDVSAASSLAGSGIPSTALAAYRYAAAREAVRRPSCGLVWPLLAGIGRVESNHGRFAGAVLHTDGVSTPRIIGIPLNGNGTERITDTDHGRIDGDPVLDRAVGPMQFIPSTWASWGVDANRDGRKDPFNIKDATAAAADYLCAAGRNLRTYAGQVQAVRSYNNSDSYIAMVLQLERVYAAGVGNIRVPVVPTSPDPHRVTPRHPPKLPPVDPGPPQGLPKPRPHPSTSASSSPSTSARGSSSSAPPQGSTSSGTSSPANSSSVNSSTAPETAPASSDSSSSDSPAPSDTTSASVGGTGSSDSALAPSPVADTGVTPSPAGG